MEKQKKPPLTAQARDHLMAERDEALAELARLRMLGALRWSPEVLKPDVPPPDNSASSRAVSQGYEARLHCTGGSGYVELFRGESTCTSHNWTRDLDKAPSGVGSRGSHHYSSTKLHALRVLRCQQEAEFARLLCLIDKAITKEC